MQSGLFGVLELQGRGLPDYMDRSLSPVVSRPCTRVPGRAAVLKELGPGPARRVVESLSTPELLHILKRWQILHPSSVPLSLVERAELIELAVQNEVRMNATLLLFVSS